LLPLFLPRRYLTDIGTYVNIVMMKIVICSSMAFAKQIKSAKEKLERKGHKIDTPEFVEEFIKIKRLRERAKGWGSPEGAKLKVEHDLIKKHFEKIKKGDAILVLNYTKNKIRNYIGGSTFLEMGFAYILDNKIYVLNPLPKQQKTFYQELLAIQPIILNGDLSKIK
jgi:hypothetical protein